MKLLLLILSLYVHQVGATVLDFDTNPEVFYVPTVTESNYVFTKGPNPNQYLGVNDDISWANNGTNDLLSWVNQGSESVVTLRHADNKRFSVDSFEFAGGSIFNATENVTTLRVEGFFEGSIIESLEYVYGDDFNRHELSLIWVGITDIDELKLTGIGGGAYNRASYDNFVVSAVPLPATVWFMGSSLLGLMGFSRKSWSQPT